MKRICCKVYLKKVLLLGTFIIVISSGHAQSDLLINTLDSAKLMRDDGNMDGAAELLNNFNTTYPDNIWVLRLYAETLFWMKEYGKAQGVYERAINLYPEDLDVKYEYAIMLFYIGNYKSARMLLIAYTANKPGLAGPESLLGITDYYLGNYKQAEVHLKLALEANPEDKKTKEFYRQVIRITHPWIEAGVAYTNDSQPLSKWVPALRAGWYRSNLFNPTLTLNYQDYTSDSITTARVGFNLKNRFEAPSAGFAAEIGAGFYYAAIDASYDYTCSLSLQQKLARHLFLRASAARTPYIYTLSSIEAPFTRNKITTSVSWEQPKKWNASAGYIGEFFPDTNTVNTFYAWVLSPTLSFSVFELNLGYAFNYANAKESRYVSEQSLDDIMNDYQQGMDINGIYDPYFTPHDQFTNSVLANLIVVPSQNVRVKLHASVGFYARTMNPYLYLDKKGNSGMTYVETGYYQESYTPLDLGVDINLDVSDRAILNLSYSYLRTFYFNSNNFLLTFKYFF